jgi:hypothetical protein
MPCRGRGRSTASSSSRDAPHGRGGREARDQYIKNEERLERLGHTTYAIPHTPLHLTEFDGRYIRDFEGEMLMRPPVDTRQSVAWMSFMGRLSCWSQLETGHGILGVL